MTLHRAFSSVRSWLWRSKQGVFLLFAFVGAAVGFTIGWYDPRAEVLANLATAAGAAAAIILFCLTYRYVLETKRMADAMAAEHQVAFRPYLDVHEEANVRLGPDYQDPGKEEVLAEVRVGVRNVGQVPLMFVCERWAVDDTDIPMSAFAEIAVLPKGTHPYGLVIPASVIAGRYSDGAKPVLKCTARFRYWGEDDPEPEYFTELDFSIDVEQGGRQEWRAQRYDLVAKRVWVERPDAA